MDEYLSECFVASQARRVGKPDQTEEGPAEAREPSENGNPQPFNEIRPTSTLRGETVPSGNQEDPVVLQQMRSADVLNTFAGLSETFATDRKAPTDVLHVGCGAYEPAKLHLMFQHSGWREIRLDIDPNVNPDVVASITDMQVISDAAVDAVYSSHNVEHLYPHEVPLALREMNRVLKPDGFAFIKLPDLQEVARFIADGKLEDPLYISPMGAIAPLDILVWSSAVAGARQYVYGPSHRVYRKYARHRLDRGRLRCSHDTTRFADFLADCHRFPQTAGCRANRDVAGTVAPGRRSANRALHA